MAIEKARAYLEKYNFEDKIKEFEVSSATVELAAQAIGCEAERIAKSLTFWVNETPVMIVAAGDTKIDNSKYKKTFGTKAKMLSFNEVEENIGHAVGGVCPFGINDNVKVYLDVSLKRFDIVYPACGSSNSCVKLTLEELEKCSGFIEWVDVCKLVQKED